MTSSDVTTPSRRQATQRVTLLGAILNVLMAVIKIIAGLAGHSHALVADGLHSLADLIADAAVLIAAKYGNQAADHNHPYGHQRIETVTTVLIAAILLATGLGIIADAYQHLHHTQPVAPLAWFVLWISLAAVVLNEGLYRYTLHVARKYSSDLLKAHAWHRRSDAATSLVVCIGILGALCGFAYLDSLAAIIMAILILKMAYQMGRQGLEELVDQGLDSDTIAAMTASIQGVPGVQAMHQLRTRSMASRILADVHIIVQPHCSVSEGHYIADQVYRTLKQQFPKVADITVHVDAEDDEVIPRPINLPSRQELQTLLHSAWQRLPGYQQLQWLNLHYLNQRLEVCIALPLSELTENTSAQLSQQYQLSLSPVCKTANLTLYFYDAQL